MKVEYETAGKGEKLKATGNKEIVAFAVSTVFAHYNFPDPAILMLFVI